MSYLNKYTNKDNVTQREQLNSTQIKNRAGGYVYQTRDWDQLARFLILGTMGATYYASEREMTRENLDNLDKCLDQDGLKAVKMAVDVSVDGRAPKNDPAILLLAKASVHKDLPVRKAAFDAVQKVCRIGTHIYQFTQFRKDLEGGWGRTMKNTIAKWFNNKTADSLAYQVAKYKNREGWTARDLLRKSHPVAPTKAHNAVYKWVASQGEEVFDNDIPKFLWACNAIKEASEKEAIKLIIDYRLPREVVPTEMLNSVAVWDALLQHMPMTAMIRNLGKMSSIGLTRQNSKNAQFVVQKLLNQEAIHKAKIHPMNVLTASMTYTNGQGVRGSLSWDVNQDITAALEDTFYMSFKNVEPTGKRTIIGLDVSPSMTTGERYGNGLMGVPGLSPRIAAAALSLITVKTEKVNCAVKGFTHQLVDLNINRNSNLKSAINAAQSTNWGGTDCALPMIWAAKNNIEADTFIIITDNDTHSGRIHPMQALKRYRKQMGINAKLIVCAMTATNYTIADPKDGGALDLVGMDSATPKLISEFSRGF